MIDSGGDVVAVPGSAAPRVQALATTSASGWRGRGRYTLGTNAGEQQRLRQQAIDLAPWSAALLDRAGVTQGMRVIDVGCGPAGIIDLLAQRVGPAGAVTGLDAMPAHVAMARAFCAEHGLSNVELVEGDATATGLPGGSFDVAHARLVLVNIPCPEHVVAEMARLVRPGGVVALHEADFATHRCYPPHPAWDRLLSAFQAIYADERADMSVGRRLPELLAGAGLTQIDAAAHLAVRPPGHSRRTLLVDLVASVADKIVDRGLLGRRELGKATEELRAHLNDPGTLVVSHVHLQAWGRRPAPAGHVSSAGPRLEAEGADNAAGSSTTP